MRSIRQIIASITALQTVVDRDPSNWAARINLKTMRKMLADATKEDQNPVK
ncbi:hypothetical protein ACRC7T_13975 [Segnochrobactraceae bacterium EtOH-i3]